MSTMALDAVCSYEQGTIVVFWNNTETWPGLNDIFFFDKNRNSVLDAHDQKALLFDGPDHDCPEGYDQTEFYYCVRAVTAGDISRYRGIVNSEYRKASSFRSNVGDMMTPVSNDGYCEFSLGPYESTSLPFRFDSPFSIYTDYSPDNPNNYTYEEAHALYTDASSRHEIAVVDPSRCDASVFYDDQIVIDGEVIRSVSVGHKDDGCGWFQIEDAFGIQMRPELYDLQYHTDDGVTYHHNDVTPAER